MDFEFDDTKNTINRQKHGIDFEEAQALWDDSHHLKIPVKTEDEPRWVVIGKIGNNHWSAIMTVREDRIRFISVRRARKEEIALYESEKLG
ncbi:MAG: BrnT family toxin [Nitrospira sp.]|nr:BrnT family toxin [Nitrospira sp.]MCA9458586.1 BrnT family toxin [Nitrospira sp.]MCW5784688.1 BrnT family toxin [Nitrospirales bacterium]